MIIYFHTKIGKFSKGPTSTLKNLFFRLSTEKQNKMHSINMIHTSVFVRARMLVMKSCLNRQDIFRKIHAYDTIVSLLEPLKADVALCQKIIGALPVEMHQLYLKEKEQKGKFKILK